MGLLVWKACLAFKLKGVSVAGHMETKRSDCHPDCYKQTSHVTNHRLPPSNHLPKGLIGIKCTDKVTIGEREVDCLLDTGSQLTTIPQSFYEENLSDIEAIRQRFGS